MIIGLILAFVTAGITIPKVLKTINDTKTITWSIF
jgi:undecaprenyl pyrophosphate phosphatase UppP